MSPSQFVTCSDIGVDESTGVPNGSLVIVLDDDLNLEGVIRSVDNTSLGPTPGMRCHISFGFAAGLP